MTRDQQILAAALRLFHERGYASVGVDAIGAAVGVSGPAIYSHFGAKAEILATLFDEAMDTVLAMAGPVREDPRDELEHLIRTQAAFALQYRELLTVYLREDRYLTQDARRRFRRRQNAFVARWVAALTALEVDAVQGRAAALIGQLNSVTGWPQAALRTPDLEALLTDMAARSVGLTLVKVQA